MWYWTSLSEWRKCSWVWVLLRKKSDVWTDSHISVKFCFLKMVTTLWHALSHSYVGLFTFILLVVSVFSILLEGIMRCCFCNVKMLFSLWEWKQRLRAAEHWHYNYASNNNMMGTHAADTQLIHNWDRFCSSEREWVFFLTLTGY